MPNTWIYCDVCKGKKFNSQSVFRQHLASRGHKLAASVLLDEVGTGDTNIHSIETDKGPKDKVSNESFAYSEVFEVCLLHVQSETCVQTHVYGHADHGISHVGENIDPQLPKCLKCGAEFNNHDRLNEVSLFDS